jgi:hypothetical protein
MRVKGYYETGGRFVFPADPYRSTGRSHGCANDEPC